MKTVGAMKRMRDRHHKERFYLHLPHRVAFRRISLTHLRQWYTIRAFSFFPRTMRQIHHGSEMGRHRHARFFKCHHLTQYQHVKNGAHKPNETVLQRRQRADATAAKEENEDDNGIARVITITLPLKICTTTLAKRNRFLRQCICMP